MFFFKKWGNDCDGIEIKIEKQERQDTKTWRDIQIITL